MKLQRKLKPQNTTSWTKSFSILKWSHNVSSSGSSPVFRWWKPTEGLIPIIKSTSLIYRTINLVHNKNNNQYNTADLEPIKNPEYLLHPSFLIFRSSQSLNYISRLRAAFVKNSLWCQAKRNFFYEGWDSYSSDKLPVLTCSIYIFILIEQQIIQMHLLISLSFNQYPVLDWLEQSEGNLYIYITN